MFIFSWNMRCPLLWTKLWWTTVITRHLSMPGIISRERWAWAFPSVIVCRFLLHCYFPSFPYSEVTIISVAHLVKKFPAFCFSQMQCCGWTGPSNWTENIVIKSEKNNSQNLYPCSCRNVSISGTDLKETGLCPSLSSEWPVFTTVQTYSLTAHIQMQIPA